MISKKTILNLSFILIICFHSIALFNPSEPMKQEADTNLVPNFKSTTINAYIESDKIAIKNDTELDNYALNNGLSGNGTIINPYVINNIEIISSNSTPSISINNTRKYIQIVNSSFTSNSTNATSAFQSFNSSNILIKNNNFFDFPINTTESIVQLNSSFDIEITENSFGNMTGAILLENSTKTLILSNIFFNLHVGIYNLATSSLIKGNYFNNIFENGIILNGQNLDLEGKKSHSTIFLNQFAFIDDSAIICNNMSDLQVISNEFKSILPSEIINVTNYSFSNYTLFWNNHYDGSPNDTYIVFQDKNFTLNDYSPLYSSNSFSYYRYELQKNQSVFLGGEYILKKNLSRLFGIWINGTDFNSYYIYVNDVFIRSGTKKYLLEYFQTSILNDGYNKIIIYNGNFDKIFNEEIYYIPEQISDPNIIRTNVGNQNTIISQNGEITELRWNITYSAPIKFNFHLNGSLISSGIITPQNSSLFINVSQLISTVGLYNAILTLESFDGDIFTDSFSIASIKDQVPFGTNLTYISGSGNASLPDVFGALGDAFSDLLGINFLVIVGIIGILLMVIVSIFAIRAITNKKTKLGDFGIFLKQLDSFSSDKQGELNFALGKITWRIEQKIKDLNNTIPNFLADDLDKYEKLVHNKHADVSKFAGSGGDTFSARAIDVMREWNSFVKRKINEKKILNERIELFNTFINIYLPLKDRIRKIEDQNQIIAEIDQSIVGLTLKELELGSEIISETIIINRIILRMRKLSPITVSQGGLASVIGQKTQKSTITRSTEENREKNYRKLTTSLLSSLSSDNDITRIRIRTLKNEINELIEFGAFFEAKQKLNKQREILYNNLNANTNTLSKVIDQRSKEHEFTNTEFSTLKEKVESNKNEQKPYLEKSLEEIELNLFYYWIEALKDDDHTLKLSVFAKETEIDGFDLQVLLNKLATRYTKIHYEEDTIYFFR